VLSEHRNKQPLNGLRLLPLSSRCSKEENIRKLIDAFKTDILKRLESQLMFSELIFQLFLRSKSITKIGQPNEF
jgi:hypothetical protein